MKTLIATTFLDSHRILECFYTHGPIEPKKMEKLLFAELYAKEPYQPDYLFKNAMEVFVWGKSHGELLSTSLSELSGMLHVRGNEIYVDPDRFGKWQELLLMLSPLVIITYRIFEQWQRQPLLDYVQWIKNIFAKSSLPSIYEPYLANIVTTSGLNECHMHLNGTTEPDRVWQDALLMPMQFYRFLVDSAADGSVEEMYLQLGSFEQNDLYRLLRIAASLRDELIKMMQGIPVDTNDQFYNETPKPLFFVSSIHPMEKVEPGLLNSPMQYEALFLIRALSYLRECYDRKFAFRLHYYQLISSFFQKLLVQQKRQIGFDQFQKITVNKLREYSEGQYKERFLQLQGMFGNHLGSLEGRFAPKTTRSKNECLMRAVMRGYDQEISTAFSLKLVPHFIKEADRRNPDSIVTFRDLSLRLKNRQTLHVLLEMLQTGTTKEAQFSQHHIVGFDAAANEMHAPAEVFSPIFRKLVFLGYSNFTYHAGEDFVHLLSGIRAIYEAIEFLEMHPGNRIGHATALGIEPQLWRKRMGDRVYIRQGEWLDNLVFVYYLCTLSRELSHLCYRLEQPIIQLFEAIYESMESVSIQGMISAWKLRKYDPFIAFGWEEPSIFDGFAQEEKRLTEEANEQTRVLYSAYHSAGAIKNSSKLIEIKTDELLDAEELRLVQNRMIDIMNEKKIAIETLPSSNVRISHYKNYSEHHLLRWFGFSREDDPQPIVVVGSDDTGIFMTNLRNEYAHIFQMIEPTSNYSKAVKIMEELVKNSKVYGFQKCDFGCCGTPIRR
ncbi:MAG TPA: hypothetical protein ENN84_06140 [Candidatus Marinimicrobia bacterium]|nr:hypothetical protein [Candidatus Neomarinimicrobiota bacterium]